MRKIKTICIFAGIGFLISFVFGLFSGRFIVFVLLRALIFTVIFALLGLGISFLFEKFLMDEGSDISSDSINVNSGSKDSVQKGQLVDVTIQDEELPPGESSNHFVVNENHQMLNKNDTTKSEPGTTAETPVAEAAPENSGFVPLKNFETVNNFSSTEAVEPSSVATEKPSERPASSSGDLDVLPDMENMDFGSKGTVGGSSDEGYEDSVADYSSSSFGSSSHKTLEDVGIQDAALMAKAISSALSNDES